ncbi:hypothetical protein [Verrucomicrobium spinosum]|uniref:hypothetical protein n=1 Tax=Verrucomicrobium spinosum TaxID=2736 RepID=UPI00017455E7|nr:hypothetical protein [Verrucomicrobium spinosum]
MNPSRPRDFDHLAFLLEQSGDAFSNHAQYDWRNERLKLCQMRAYVLRHAPEDIRRAAASQAAHCFHPKAEFDLPDGLKLRVEEMALELKSAKT